MEYCTAKRAHVEFLQSNAAEENFESNTDFHCNSCTSNQSSDYEEVLKVLKKSLQNIKTKVVDMVTNFSVYLAICLPFQWEKNPRKNAQEDGDDIAFVDVAKLMGLVVMVIAITFFTRG